MWAARLLLLAVGAAAFHLQESTPVPEPTLSGVNEATSIIPVEPESEPEEEEVRALKLAMLEEWLRKAFFDLSYSDVKKFIPDEIIDFFENLSFNDAQHLQKAVTVFQQAIAIVQEKPESNAHQALQSAWKLAINHLEYFDAELAKKVVNLQEWFCSHFLKLKPQTIKRVGLWIEGWFAAVKEADNRASEANLKTLKAAREEFTERPLFDVESIIDWMKQFPKLENFFVSPLFVLAKVYYETYQSGRPLFHYVN